MKTTLASNIGFCRSPSPISNINIKGRESLEKPSKAAMRVLVNSSNSYKKLRKICINDSSLVFIHKVKEKDINSTARKLLNPHLSIIPLNTSSIPVISKSSIIECSQRGSPYLLNSKSPDLIIIPKIRCKIVYSPNKIRSERDSYRNELSTSLNSNPEPVRITTRNNLKYIGKNPPQGFLRNSDICMSIKGFKSKQASSRLRRVNEIRNISKESVNSSKYSTGVQVDDSDFTACRS